MICYWGTICTPLYKSLFQKAKIQDPKKLRFHTYFVKKIVRFHTYFVKKIVRFHT